eukprot:g4547.t1
MVWPSSFASKCRAVLLYVMLEMVCAVEGEVEGDRRQLRRRRKVRLAHEHSYTGMYIIVFLILALFSIMGFVFLFRRCVSERRAMQAGGKYTPVGPGEFEDIEMGWDPEDARLKALELAAQRKEERLAKKLERMQKNLNLQKSKLDSARGARIQLTARLDSARGKGPMDPIMANADERGRKLFGEEVWDAGVNGAPPLRMLLTLDESEMQTVRDGVEEVLTARRSSSSSSTRGNSDSSTARRRQQGTSRKRWEGAKDFSPKSQRLPSARSAQAAVVGNLQNKHGDDEKDDALKEYVGHANLLSRTSTLRDALRHLNKKN